MAVQAQYPSNTTLFHRNEHETKILDYTLQDPLFPIGGSANTRKRGREPATATTTTSRVEEHNHLHPAQPSPCRLPTTLGNPQGQTQHHHHHQLGISTGLGLSLEERSRPQQQHQQKQQQQQHPPQTHLSSSLFGDLAAMSTFQTDEIGWFIQAQGENLRRALEETTRSHRRKLAAILEESFSRRLRAKEAELEKAARRHAELEERVARLAADSTSLQAKARAAEAAAVALQAQLRQATAVEEGGEADSESACVDPRREEVGRRGAAICRWCGVRAAEVLLLPCRHLCLCRSCGSAVENCPVCFCVRSACVQVYLS